MNIGSAKEKQTHVDSDIKALKGSEDIKTSDAIAQAAKDAGYGDGAVLIHGNDESYDEMVRRFASSGKPTLYDTSVHVAEGLDAAEVGSLGIVADTLAPVAALVIGSYEIVEANVHGRELNHALQRDEAHVALLANLKLPNEFKQQEIAKYPHAGTTFQAGSQKITTTLTGKDHALMAVAQLHCDEGMLAAKKCFESGSPPSPYVLGKCREDAAYRAGFEAAVWAHGKDAQTYDALLADLKTRTDQYVAAQVNVIWG
jgi:hypothetical protein